MKAICEVFYATSFSHTKGFFNYLYVLFGENCSAVIFSRMKARILSCGISIARCRAPFSCHVSQVFCVCAEPQMLRIHTQRDIACMAHAFPWFNGSTMQSIGKAVRSGVFILYSYSSIFLPSLIRYSWSIPHPAVLLIEWDGRIFPETLNSRKSWIMSSSAFVRTFFTATRLAIW